MTNKKSETHNALEEGLVQPSERENNQKSCGTGFCKTGGIKAFCTPCVIMKE